MKYCFTIWNNPCGLWNISLCSIWNKINPYTLQRISQRQLYHMLQHISQIPSGIYFIEKTTSFEVVFSGGDGGNRSYRFGHCFAIFRIVCPFCWRKRWTIAVSVTAVNKKTIRNWQFMPCFGLFLFGGDGGNRNRVRKSIHTAFSGCSQSFEIPFS